MSGYYIDIKHDGLGKFRRVRGSDLFVTRQLAQQQINQWDEQWERKLEMQEKRTSREDKARYKESRKEEAQLLTQQAQEARQSIDTLLLHTLGIHDAVDWESLKDKAPFGKAPPIRPNPEPYPSQPLESNDRYKPKHGILGVFSSGHRSKKDQEAKAVFEFDLKNWRETCSSIDARNSESQASFEASMRRWEEAKLAYEQQQAESNDSIERDKAAYLRSEPDAVSDYCNLVLARSEYPECFPKDYEIEYKADQKIVIVEFALPLPEDMPQVKEYKYVQTNDEIKETKITKAEADRLYDSAIYQTTLRTIHELFEADNAEAIDYIVFNGIVNFVDKKTGRTESACIASVGVKKSEFVPRNLSGVAPKECFKDLKGTSASQLTGLTPVAPTMQIDRADKRFIESYSVVEALDQGSNLAAMTWEDFEHFVREVLEMEFKQAGAEVRVTQSSRDGGVDAVIFDPDPVRGGKMVIQAKKYTGTVGVSAVRDLYGTLMNEGAMKGILITTSDYGPDAYEFAKGKPITLLNGGNLLHLLGKHGHNVRIDLQEAKKLAAMSN